MKKFFITFAAVAAVFSLGGYFAASGAKKSLTAYAAEHHKKIEEAANVK